MFLLIARGKPWDLKAALAQLQERVSAALEAARVVAVRHPVGAAATGLLALIVFVAVFAELVATYDPVAQDYMNALQPPGTPGSQGPPHILGTDNLGRDVFSRVVYGTRISLAVGAAAVLIGTIGGLVVGLFSGYRGGRVDLVLQRVMDAVEAVPTLVLAMLLVAVMGRSLVVTAIAIGVTQIPRANRIIRSNVLSVLQEQYIEAARAVGVGGLRIALRHVTPNVMPATLVVFSTSVGAAIVVEATLSFLGLAASPPLVTWGGMLTIGGRQYMMLAPWLLIAPAAALTLTTLAFNFVGDAIRDVFDPRLRTS